MPLQRFKIADDDGQEIIEVVGDAAGELTDAFHFLGLPQALFGGAPFGQIARHLRKANELPSASRIALITTLAQNRVPSLRTRQPSASNFPVLSAVSIALPVYADLFVFLRIETAKNAAR